MRKLFPAFLAVSFSLISVPVVMGAPMAPSTPPGGAHGIASPHASATKSNSAKPAPESSKSTTSKGTTSSSSKADQKSAESESANAKTDNENGKTDGSFEDGKYVISKDNIHKNGFHKGFPVVVVVDKGSHYTYIFQKQEHDKVVEVLRASNAVGKDDTPTPYGPYKVADKLKWPSWIPPKSIDPKQKAIPPYNKTHKNPLGVARITLNKFGIALHGTNDPHSLRKDVSHGCIRHSNKDILKIFNMVKKGDTVIIAHNLVGTTLTKKEFGSKKDR